jgi:hypothetical protein
MSAAAKVAELPLLEPGMQYDKHIMGSGQRVGDLLRPLQVEQADRAIGAA